MPHRVLRSVLSIGIAVALTAAATAETLSPDQMRTRAVTAVAEGDNATAQALTDALLARDPADVTALLVRSRAQRNAGDYDAALATAKQAWRTAETDGEKYRSALLVAQALSSQGARLRSQFWLRRAAEIAPGEAERRRAVADLRHVRNRTPTRVKLSFAVAPTSNANGGATSDQVELFGLPIVLSGSALALSGTRFAFGADIERIISVSERSRTTLSLDLSHQTYRLSGEAKRIAPDADGSDFAQTGVGLGLVHDISAGAGAGYWSLGGVVNADWYGGHPLARSARFSLGRSWRSDGGTFFQAEIAAEYTKRLQGNDATPFSMGVSFDAAHRITGGTLRLGLFASESRADSMSFDFTTGTVSVGYTLGRPVLTSLGGGMGLTIRAAYGLTDFDATPYQSGGRLDRVVQGSVTATFRGLDYYGFAPSVTLEGSRRSSNVDLFDTDRLGVSLGVVSTF
ncbi:hypothetical protein ILP92_08245 [Maribius pontilimi]|uniref:Tetratricopeptide repeat-containing protein n=1 Tax=Palleronia pontilimi TaxID=1964209 RepID=A0A934IGL0_9RHOB|nr:porin family protein [Palleronia pontilimi]MBJ3762732.1 hypothetical protein [Palleronia pontilimi]